MEIKNVMCCDNENLSVTCGKIHHLDNNFYTKSSFMIGTEKPLVVRILIVSFYAFLDFSLTMAYYNFHKLLGFPIYIFSIIFEAVLVWTYVTLIKEKGPLDQNWRGLVHAIFHTISFVIAISCDLIGDVAPPFIKFAAKSYLSQSIIYYSSLTSFFDFPKGFTFPIFALVAIIESSRCPTVPIFKFFLATFVFTYVFIKFGQTILLCSYFAFFLISYFIMPN